MNVKNKLRNSIVRKLQQLSTEKLTEVNNLLGKIDRQLKYKEATIKLAGAWKDLGDDFFDEVISDLHDKRANDRKIV